MAKIITIKEALNLVKDNDHIVAGMAASEGREFFTHLHEIADNINHVTIDNCLPLYPYEFMVNDAYKNHFTINSWFFSGDLRKAFKNKNIAFIPNQLHFAGKKRAEHMKPNIFIGNATPPDKHGFVSLSLSNVYEKHMIEVADKVILEINPHLPRTFGDLEVHQNDIDYFIEVDYKAPVLPDAEPSEKDLLIGKNIAEYIHDGDTIQLGIGGIPNAVAAALSDKKDLGVHTEMLTTGFMKLFKQGVVTNKKKSLHKGKMVCAFALGTQELYDFLDNNPAVMFLDGNYVNDPMVIGLNDNQVSINTTIEVDLTGQCCSESIGTMQFSGTGGQTDTATGAQRAKNGRSFIALYSTTMAKNPETGEREEISKIVSTLKPGAAVSLSRNDVDYVVTEFGVAHLRGTSIKERVERLIAIAHPKFKEQLKKEAEIIGYI
ncbi:acetyl-CoA hydrolase/transferase family protein [Liberiplasma polymorphum]|jgi:acyl-CoA hydrolase|uniref:acetyl-CoA hydrolase/transferase family protein n=1 Tax=Liberiplasma polymorphum TaxID=3374570 RepID=UPI0037717249